MTQLLISLTCIGNDRTGLTIRDSYLRSEWATLTILAAGGWVALTIQNNLNYKFILISMSVVGVETIWINPLFSNNLIFWMKNVLSLFFIDGLRPADWEPGRIEWSHNSRFWCKLIIFLAELETLPGPFCQYFCWGEGATFCLDWTILSP